MSTLQRPFAAPGRVYTTEAFAAPECVCKTGAFPFNTFISFKQFYIPSIQNRLLLTMTAEKKYIV
jgi:hypothetical protein